MNADGNDGPLVHAVDAAPDLSNGGLGIAVDETGVVAVAHYRRVTFTDPTRPEPAWTSSSTLASAVSAGLRLHCWPSGADGSSYPTQTERRMARFG